MTPPKRQLGIAVAAAITAVLVAGTGVYLATASGKPRTAIEADE